MLTPGSVRIHIEDSFAGLPRYLLECGLPLHRAMVVGDTNTLPLYGEEVKDLLRPLFREVRSYAFPAGEKNKTLSSVEELIGVLIACGYDRGDCIFALGGGVTGDMAGFAAAIFLRGIAVVQLPTTLLAQVDSGIGGKTGVDYRGFKNMIGAFHMPVFTYSNVSTLKTLPAEQFSAGMGEVIKSALIADADLLRFLRDNAGGIMGMEPSALMEMIRRTSGIKADIVGRDPGDRGERALLNLGHTVGHAIEKYGNFRMLHGHCVGAGLTAAARISADRGLLTESEVSEIRDTLDLYGVTATVPGLDTGAVLRYTKSDKKMSEGQIRFILIDGIGRAAVFDDVSDEELIGGIRAAAGERLTADD